METLLESSKGSGFSWPQVAFLADEIKRGIKAPELLKEEPKPVLTEEKAPVYSHIINHHLNEAGHWYEIKLEHDIVTWQVKARGNHEILYCFEPSHATYVSLPAGQTLAEDTVPDRQINAIYVMCETAPIIVEFELWRHGDKNV